MKELTREAFPEFIHSNELVIIHFWAKWDRYDEQMKNLLKLEIRSERALAVATIDTGIEENWPICQELGIRNLPSLAFYRSGSLVKLITGLGVAGVRAAIEELEAPLRAPGCL